MDGSLVALGQTVKTTVPAELPTGWSNEPGLGTLPEGASAAQVLAALGFLALIAGLLIHWSGHEACEKERSVFPSSR